MNTLYDSLVSGEVEYKDAGIVRRPPTTAALRAARTLMEQRQVITSNSELIQQLQLRVGSYLAEIQQLTERLNNESVPSVCEDTQHGRPSDVACDSGVS